MSQNEKDLFMELLGKLSLERMVDFSLLLSKIEEGQEVPHVDSY